MTASSRAARCCSGWGFCSPATLTLPRLTGSSTTCRALSRSAAKRSLRGADVAQSLAQKGITVRAGSMASLAEEASEAYKDVAQVVEVTHRAGISRKVAKLRPIGVVKG